MKSSEGYISGGDILAVTSTENVPDFLRTIPALRKLSFVPAAPLVGGVTSNAYSEYVHVYAVFSDTSLVGIRIRLDSNI